MFKNARVAMTILGLLSGFSMEGDASTKAPQKAICDIPPPGIVCLYVRNGAAIKGIPFPADTLYSEAMDRIQNPNTSNKDFAKKTYEGKALSKLSSADLGSTKDNPLSPSILMGQAPRVMGHGPVNIREGKLTISVKDFIKNMTDAEAAFLSRIEDIHGLSVENIEEIRFNDRDLARYLNTVLMRLPKLTDLSLSFLKLSDRDIQVLCPALKKMTKLESLSLTGHKIKDIVGLADAISAMPNLQILDLSDNELGGSAVSPLVNALKHTPMLISLNLDQNKLGTTHLMFLRPILDTLPNLLTLIIGTQQVKGSSRSLQDGVQKANVGRTLKIILI